jgi:hypothetical protein
MASISSASIAGDTSQCSTMKEISATQFR